MTDRLAAAHDRLEAWGRWARSGDPLHLVRNEREIHLYAHIEAPVGVDPCYEFMTRRDPDDPGWADDVAPDVARPPIDEPQVMHTDYIIRLVIHWRHRKIIKLHFWKLRRQEEEYVGAAVRAVADATEPLSKRLNYGW